MPFLVTPLVESDFLHLRKVGTEYGWKAQAYNVPAHATRESFGRHVELFNVILDLLKDGSAWLGFGIYGGDTGLRLWVLANDSDGIRCDIQHGSFHIVMNVNEPCGAFFWVNSRSLVSLVETIC